VKRPVVAALRGGGPSREACYALPNHRRDIRAGDVDVDIDVGIDTAGALIAVVAVGIIRWRRS
jgi:hypothetical protein